MSQSAAILDEPSPCDGRCFAERCRDERLACDAFAVFASGAAQWRWSGAPRVPTREQWLELFDA